MLENHPLFTSYLLVLRPGFIKGFTSFLQMLNSMLSKVTGQSGADLPCSGKVLRNLILQFDSDCLMASLSPAIQGSDIHSKAQMLRRSSGGSGSKKVNLESGCCTRLARSACGAAQFYMLALKYA